MEWKGLIIMEPQEDKTELLLNDLNINEDQINESVKILEEEISNLKREILKKEMLIEKIINNN